MSSRTFTAAVCFGALVFAAAETVEAQRFGRGPRIPSQRELGRYGLQRAWWGQATLNVKRDKVRHLTADEESLYVQATSGVVTAFDIETGRKRWAVQLGRRDQASYPLVSNEEFALVAVGMQLFALDKLKGELLWEINLPANPSTSPAIDERNVYIGALDGSVYAFSLRRIRQLYEENLLPQWSHETLMWRYKTAKEITTPPISTGRVVEFASLDRSLYSVTVERREQIFQFEMDAPISAPMVRAGDRLYMASEDFNFYCLNAENGTVIWEFVTGLPVRKAPVVIGSQVFVLPDRGGMFCLSASHGKQIWWRPRGTGFIAATSKLIFMSDPLGNVVLVDREDGAPVGALPLRDFSKRLTNDRTDRLLLATESGLVISIRDRDRDFPLYHKYPERRPILPVLVDESEKQQAPPAEEPPAEPAAQP